MRGTLFRGYTTWFSKTTIRKLRTHEMDKKLQGYMPQDSYTSQKRI